MSGVTTRCDRVPLLALGQAVLGRRSFGTASQKQWHTAFPGSLWQTSSGTRRRGLSMLELVLWLPLLLFVMALMINFGTVASWRVRELSVARHAVWASRYPRGLARHPGGLAEDEPGSLIKPSCWWPDEATMSAGGAGNLAELDDPAFYHPVVRGPLPMGTVVDDELLDPTRGLLRGTAHLSRPFPLLGSLGPYRMDAEELLLDRQWQHREMHADAWDDQLWTTRTRRMPVIYTLPQADAVYIEDFVSAVIAILYAPFHIDLAPLDRDDEFIYYSRRFAGSGTFPYHGAPDFHPRLRLQNSWPCQSDCDASAEYVKKKVEELIKQIEGDRYSHPRIPSLAERMTDAFIGLYKAVQEELQRQIDAGADNAAALEAEITALETNINTLEQFKASLGR